MREKLYAAGRLASITIAALAGAFGDYSTVAVMTAVYILSYEVEAVTLDGTFD